jgi:hypothetical protein
MKTTTPRTPSDDVLRCSWSTHPDPGPIFAISGWFTLAVSASGESRAAPNSFTRSGPLPHSGSGLSLSPATPQKPLRADEPVKQNGELDTLRVDGVGRRRTAGIETRVWSGRPPSCRVGSVRVHSVVGPHRSGLSRVLTIRSPVRGPIQSWWGRACAAARRERSSLRSRSRSIRGRRCCPSSACSSPDRAGVSRGRRSGPVHVFSFEAVLVLCA